MGIGEYPSFNIYIYIYIYLSHSIIIMCNISIPMIFPWETTMNPYGSHESHDVSFAARTEDGSIVTWGGRRSGGDASAVAKQLQVASVRWRKDARTPIWRPMATPDGIEVTQLGGEDSYVKNCCIVIIYRCAVIVSLSTHNNMYFLSCFYFEL